MNSNQNKNNTPFWAPWGMWGYLWRLLVFLLTLVLLAWAFSLLRGCEHKDKTDVSEENERRSRNPYEEDDQYHDNDPYRDLRDRLRAPIDSEYPDSIGNRSYPDRQWIDEIPDVPELPNPDDNYIPPVDSTRIVTNPEDSISKIVGDELIVLFNSKDVKKDIADFARKFKELYPSPEYAIKYYNPMAGSMILQVPQAELLTVANALPTQIPDIDFKVATNSIMKQSGKPSDPDFTVPKYDEYFKLIQAYDAWDITKGSPEVKVAIVDSYFDLTNPEIGQRYENPIHIPSKTTNVLPPARNPQDKSDLISYCHGSHVAGIAIGGQDNGIGVSGIAPNCTWIPISLGTELTSFNIMEGILYAIYQGADVVNFSIGRDYGEDGKNIPLGDQIEIAKTSDLLGEDMWEYILKVADEHNCTLVTSAGNSTVLMGMDPKNRSSHLIKVEAVDGKGKKADFSNYGEVPEANLEYSTISAPGVGIWSVSEKRCLPIWKANKVKVSTEQGLQEMQGTSMAAPVVAGAVALIKSKNKDLTNEQIIKILKMTAKEMDPSGRIGPVLQIRDALDAVTNGEKLNFDDLMQNHDLLIGKWKSTREINIIDTQTREKIDEVWAYFIFPNANQGTLEYHSINTPAVFTAPLKVEWLQDRVRIVQLHEARCSGYRDINKTEFVGTPDSQRMLHIDAKNIDGERFEFNLEKVY